MKMKTLAFLALIFSTCFNLAGQAPGYLGKKAILSFNISSSFTIDGPTQNNRGRFAFGEPTDLYGISYEFESSFSYVIGRYSSLELTASQYYTGLVSEAWTIAKPVEIFGGNEDYHELFHRLNVKSISLTYSIFRSKKGALAPIGNRFYYGLKRNAIKGSILDKNTKFFEPDFGEVRGHEPLNLNQEMAINHVLFGWSNTLVFWDKLVFITGLRFALPLSLDFENYIINDPRDHPDFSNNRNKAEFETSVSNRIISHEIFRFNVAVGYLLF